jgi:hypothetical protein
LIRSYVLRRWFNARLHNRIHRLVTSHTSPDNS